MVPVEVYTRTWTLKSHDRSDKKNILTQILFNYQNENKIWNSWWRFPGYPSMFLSLERPMLRNSDPRTGLLSLSTIDILWWIILSCGRLSSALWDVWEHFSSQLIRCLQHC